MLTEYIKPLQKLFAGLSYYGFQIPPELAEFAQSIASPAGHVSGGGLDFLPKSILRRVPLVPGGSNSHTSAALRACLSAPTPVTPPVSPFSVLKTDSEPLLINWLKGHADAHPPEGSGGRLSERERTGTKREVA